MREMVKIYAFYIEKMLLEEHVRWVYFLSFDHFSGSYLYPCRFGIGERWQLPLKHNKPTGKIEKIELH